MSSGEVVIRRRVRSLESEQRKAHKRHLVTEVGRDGIWPLSAPGMPPPGPDFLIEANRLQEGDSEYKKGTKKNPAVFTVGERLKDLYRRALREPGFEMRVEGRNNTTITATFVPGHIWSQFREEWEESVIDWRKPKPRVDGPHPAEVMILGKMPWTEEHNELRNLVGASGKILLDAIKKLRIKGCDNWYVTNLVKFMPPEGKTDLKANWIHDCLPLLHQELRIVRPKYILCLGADASKWLLGSKFNVSYMAGRVVPFTYPMRMTSEDDQPDHTAHVMTVLHPAEVARTPDKGRVFESNLSRFSFLLTGKNFDIEEQGLDHRVCRSLEEAEEWVDEVNADMAGLPLRERLIAWDLEWEGQHPVNKGTYVRTIQASWGPKKAICFVVRECGGQKIGFRDRDGKPAIKRLVALLNRLMVGKRAVGHFLVSDMEWAESMGLKLVQHCKIPLYKDKHGRLPWQQLRAGAGWLDTAMMCHAIEETAQLGLESLTMRYTTAPRYDIKLDDWKTEYCKSKEMKKEALEGYGNCPDDILYPYALYDADVTRRIAVELLPLLDHDYDGNCCWESCWESMIVQKPILKIHQNGFMTDRTRIDDLTLKFLKARTDKEKEIRDYAQWPEFNIRSLNQVREFLFGEALNGAKRVDPYTPRRLRPDDAISLNLEPILDTSKPPRLWKDLKAKQQDHLATPGTSKLILGILAQENLNQYGPVNMVRDHRFLDQVLKSVLRTPRTEEGSEDRYVENEDGFLEYDAGLAASIDDDGRVRTHIYPTAETKRFKHARPNLANLSKRRDPDYARMLGATNVNGKWVGGAYTHKIRSVLKASPGYALIDFDYAGAELLMMALMSGSMRMLDHCQRSLLNEDDPNYYDIHSNVAVLAFSLKCRPTKSGLDSIGKIHFRILAKNVIFGVAYGRGAKAIALAAKEEGVNVSVDEAQAVIDAIFDMYPELVPFFEEARRRALEDKWLCNCFGAFRRFPTTEDLRMEGEFERQAMNFPIQSGVAGAMDRGLAYLQDEIERQGLDDDMRLLLQIHDAGIVEARYHMIEPAVEIIRWAMETMVEIWPTDLAGIPRGDGPYHLGLEFEINDHWSEKFSYERAVELGIPTQFAAKPKS